MNKIWSFTSIKKKLMKFSFWKCLILLCFCSFLKSISSTHKVMRSFNLVLGPAKNFKGRAPKNVEFNYFFPNKEVTTLKKYFIFLTLFYLIFSFHQNLIITASLIRFYMHSTGKTFTFPPLISNSLYTIKKITTNNGPIVTNRLVFF